MLASSKKTITNLGSIIGTSLVAQTVKHLPTMQKTQVQSLGREDLLEISWRSWRRKWQPTLKSRDITLLTKVHLVKAMVFPVVVYGCENRTIKKAEHRGIDAFVVLRVPWTARRSNQSILKEISHEYSLEGLMLKLKLQYFGQMMGRTYSLEKTLMLGKIEGRRLRG